MADIIKSIGFFYQVFNQRRATAFVLTNVRKVYPKAPITVISDGGDDFADCAGKFRCEYRHESQTGDGQSIRFPSAAKAHMWLDRLASAMESHKAKGCDWTMLLEDDTWVRGPVTEPATDFAGTYGAPWNQPQNPGVLEVRYFITENCPGVPLMDRYGGCGGTLLRTKTTSRVLRKMLAMRDFDRLYKRLWQLRHSDILLTLALNLGGIGYSISACHAECGDCQRPNATVIHGYKTHYRSAR